MITTKVFKQGNSQAVRLPKEFRFDVDEVFIRREGDTVVLIPKPASRWRHVRACIGQVQGELDRPQAEGFDERQW
ncbi:MAG: AbrB/MazE/SpoVT family DNA-binding domain-containing protein [Rhodocyclaceae bacterium]|nr:AbrB/MazE/SpoVT family DNA-binding domain-containing protein [Rhodocyclaceae bacterium]